MKAAIAEARKAEAVGDVPVGAIAVMEGKIIARAHNLKEKAQDPTGHAEILLLRKTAKKLKSWRLSEIEVYVTLEPCLMCVGALIQARVKRVVYGTDDPKAGACGSLFDYSNHPLLNHAFPVSKHVLKEACGTQLSSFFGHLRKKNR